jgi:hypothetical protein
MVVHDLYIARVKSSAQLTEPHAWYEILSTIPAATAFPAGTDCKMAQQWKRRRITQPYEPISGRTADLNIRTI